MPLAKALKSFKGRYGHIRAGSTFNCEPGYFGQLIKKGWVELAKDQREPQPDSKDKPPPGPGDNRDKGGAPGKAGKGEAGTGSKPAQKGQRAGGRKGTAAQRGGGQAVTSRSLRQDLRSQEQTPPSSENGEKNPSDQESSDPDDVLP